MTTRPHPKQLATGTPEDGYTVQYSAGDSIWIPTTNSVFGRTGYDPVTERWRVI